MTKKDFEHIILVLHKVRTTMEYYSAVRLVAYLLVFEKYDKDDASPYDDHHFTSIDRRVFSQKQWKDFLLSDYILGIEDYYGIEVNLFSRDLTNIVSTENEDDVCRICRIISETAFESKELCDFFRFIFVTAEKYQGKARRDFLTNESTSRLMGALSHAESGMSLYDGLCGIGDTVIAADNGCNIFMQDSRNDVVAMAAINAILHDKRKVKIRVADSFLNPITKERMDRIVCVPPFGMKMTREYINELCYVNNLPFSEVTSDSAAVVQMANKLMENGVGIIQVPYSFLFKGGKNRMIRERLIREYIDCVIELPAGAHPYTSVVTALLILYNGKSRNDILFIDSSSMWTGNIKNGISLGDNELDEIVQIYDERRVSECSILVECDEVIENECKLSPRTYLSKEVLIEVEDLEYLKEQQKRMYTCFVEINKKLNEMREEDADE